MMAFAAAAALMAAVATAPPTSSPDSLVGPGEEVPYVGQEPLLCGGASLAMVLRFWGETGVYAEDFEPLVREEDGGIRTTDLAAAVEARGYTAFVDPGRPETVFDALAAGMPVVVLLDRGEPTLHYVVLVQADGSEVWFHDPAVGPMRSISRAELVEQWSASGGWALVPVPREHAGTHVDSADRDAGPRGPAPPPVSDVSDLTERALASLNAGRFDDAKRLARRMVASGGEDARVGHRVLATALYLSGQPDRALAEWNVLGEPLVDLVTIHGSRASRHDVLMARTGLEPGDVLTSSDLELARRRLEEEPSLDATRVGYRPNPDGTVQVHAYVVDRALVPSVPSLGVEAVRGLVNEEVRLDGGPFMGSADRWALRGGWSSERSFAGGSVRTPVRAIPGIVTLSLDWARERYGVSSDAGSVVSEARLRAGVGLHEWVGAHTRVGGSLGLERWRSDGHVGSVSLDWLRKGDLVRSSARLDGWAGGGRAYARGGVDLALRVPTWDHQEARWMLGATATTSGAPRLVWPGAGTGRIRSALLRAYPLSDGGVVSGAGFGPRLVHGTVEYRVSSLLGPIRYGAGLFADAAYLPGGDSSGTSRTLGDVGVQIFADPGGSEAAVSLARGAHGWVLSARVTEAW